MRKSLIALSVLGFGVASIAEVSLPTAAGAQEVKGPKITWRMSLWGKRRAFTEAPEYTAKTISEKTGGNFNIKLYYCLLYTSPSPRDGLLSRMPSSA